MKKICHLSSAHRGLDVRIFDKQCVSLAAAGYETHLVINASAQEIKKAATYGVTIHTLAPTPRRISRMLKQAWRCYRMARAVNADIYHFHDPELIPYGMLLYVAGKKVIYDVHEDVPKDILSKEWIPSWARKIVALATASLEHIGARYCFAVVTATPTIANRFCRIAPRVIDINNYPLLDELASVQVKCMRKPQICYVGGVTRIRGLKPVLEALPLVPEITLVLCGEFSDADFEAELKSMPGWNQVEYKGHVSRVDVHKIMNESIAGIVTFFPIPNHVDAQPNKMFEYMSAGLPVIASHFAMWRELIEGSGAGICVNPSSPVEIASAIRRLAKEPALVERFGVCGRQAVLNGYNWPTEARRLLTFYGRNL